MPPEIPATSLQLNSIVKANATLELSLAEVDVPELGENVVLVRVGAAPINPSDTRASSSMVMRSKSRSTCPAWPLVRRSLHLR